MNNTTNRKTIYRQRPCEESVEIRIWREYCMYISDFSGVLFPFVFSPVVRRGQTTLALSKQDKYTFDILCCVWVRVFFEFFFGWVRGNLCRARVGSAFSMMCVIFVFWCVFYSVDCSIYIFLNKNWFICRWKDIVLNFLYVYCSFIMLSDIAFFFNWPASYCAFLMENKLKIAHVCWFRYKIFTKIFSSFWFREYILS